MHLYWASTKLTPLRTGTQPRRSLESLTCDAVERFLLVFDGITAKKKHKTSLPLANMAPQVAISARARLPVEVLASSTPTVRLS